MRTGIPRGRQWLRARILCAATIATGCASSLVPMHQVAVTAPVPAPTRVQRIHEALADLGYALARGEGDLVVTDWVYKQELVHLARHRAVVQVIEQPEPALAVAVQREVHDGARWRLDGEDEERRKQLVATLLARFQLPPEE